MRHPRSHRVNVCGRELLPGTLLPDQHPEPPETKKVCSRAQRIRPFQGRSYGSHVRYRPNQRDLDSTVLTASTVDRQPLLHILMHSASSGADSAGPSDTALERGRSIAVTYSNRGNSCPLSPTPAGGLSIASRSRARSRTVHAEVGRALAAPVSEKSADTVAGVTYPTEPRLHRA